MDHRSQTISNEAKRKKADPVFGVLSFMSAELPNGQWAVHQIALSGAHHEQQAFPVIDTWARPTEKTISHVKLAAFGKAVEFSDLTAAASNAISHISEWAEGAVTDAVGRYAEANGLDPNAVLAEVSGLTVCISAQFATKGSP